MDKELIGNFDIFLRSVISFVILFLLAKVMGKKQISQLNFFDYTVGITIGSIAATFSIDSRIAYPHGLISLIVWGLLPIAIAYSTIKSITARRFFGGTPTLLVQNGRIIEDSLKKERFNVNDLLEELRLNGVFDITDVEFAILETNGKISVQLKSQKEPITPASLNIPTQYKGLSANLIIDGKVMEDNLKLVNLDKNWLINELKKRNISSFDEIFLASLNSNGILFIDKKNIKQDLQTVLE